MGRSLMQALALAVMDMRRRRNECLTLEHVLLAMTHERIGRIILEGLGVDLAGLRHALDEHLTRYLPALEEGAVLEVVQSPAVERTLERALMHMQSAGRSRAEVGDLLAAMYEEEDSFAVYFLRRQGISRLDILDFISHDLPQIVHEQSFEADIARAGEARQRTEGEEGESGEGQENRKASALEKYTRDLVGLARQGGIDPLVGREREVSRLMEVLSRRRKNNPLLVGEPGTGKTAVAEGLALRIAEGRVPESFHDAPVYSLDMGALLAGARYRGDFESRIKSVVRELGEKPGAILVIDEIHTIVGAGATSGGSMDASNLLKPVLASGGLRCIGSTTHEEFRNHFEKDRALSRRFQRIEINEPSEADCLEILRGLQPKYEMFHKVRYSRGAVQAAVELSSRYVRDRLLPDKAIDVMDEAGAAASLRPGFKPGAMVAVQDMERVVARMAGLPPRAVNRGEKERLRNLENDLKGRIFGQDEAVDGVTRAILRSRAGLGKAERPAAAFLFHGPTGVGKTELARSLADILGVAFLRFDMSEYMEKHAVARLIGSPPGYVGFEQGGLLTEAVRRTPRAVVLLDELEKAHPDIYNILLQVMDYATLTDNSGRKADFRNVILIMTTNAGAREMDASPLGFPAAGNGKGAGDASRRGARAVEQEFSPEFRNRLDAVVAFHSLTPELMGRIVDKTVQELFAGLEAKKVRLTLTDAARDWLAARGFDAKMGARPLQRLVRAELEDELAKQVLFGELERGGDVMVDAAAPDAEHLSFSVEARK